jgi:hypothetical protein
VDRDLIDLIDLIMEEAAPLASGGVNRPPDAAES